MTPTASIINGNSLDILPTIPDASIDAVISDPPYPEVKRPYGKLTESQWHHLMNNVVDQCRRILKPKGSALFILQPNSLKVGKMRLWLWEFLLNTAKNWNLVQDVYWWNSTALSTSHSHKKYGLMKPSIKPCLWFGEPDCYRDQTQVLWELSDVHKARRYTTRATVREKRPSGASVNPETIFATAEARGGSAPFNLIPISGSGAKESKDGGKHEARTPKKLCDWWIRYITPPGGTVLDPFSGSGTTGVAATALGRNYIGIEKVPAYCDISKQRLADYITL